MTPEDSYWSKEDRKLWPSAYSDRAERELHWKQTALSHSVCAHACYPSIFESYETVWDRTLSQSGFEHARGKGEKTIMPSAPSIKQLDPHRGTNECGFLFQNFFIKSKWLGDFPTSVLALFFPLFTYLIVWIICLNRALLRDIHIDPNFFLLLIILQ